MKHVVLTVIALLTAGVLGGAGVVLSGAYDVAADSPHWPITSALLNAGRVNSIKAHASGITVPADLDSPEHVLKGAMHFATHCAECHSAPGVPPEDLADGLYPKPPVLTAVSRRYDPGELFWILRHGIKMSAMPSWNDHGAEALWHIVAFLDQLPTMTPSHYQALLKSVKQQGMTHDMDNMPGMNAGTAASSSRN